MCNIVDPTSGIISSIPLVKLAWSQGIPEAVIRLEPGRGVDDKSSRKVIQLVQQVYLVQRCLLQLRAGKSNGDGPHGGDEPRNSGDGGDSAEPHRFSQSVMIHRLPCRNFS
jgi:hypothetical protein